MKILVTADAFRIGGRETFLQTYGGALASNHGYDLYLMVSKISPSAVLKPPFLKHIASGDSGQIETARDWLSHVPTLVSERQIDLIWAHHYNLFATWLVAEFTGRPLLVTFHGPLKDGGSPTNGLEAIGAVLSMRLARGVTGVSEEIQSHLRGFGIPQRSQVLFTIPNAVKIPTLNLDMSRKRGPKHFVVVCRREKLQHLRVTTQIFHRIRCRWPRARLSIVVPESSEGGDYRKIVGLLGAKWCLAQGLRFLESIRHMRCPSTITDSSSLMAECDLVFGMGRVLLEALAQNRPAFLVGYEHPYGLVTEKTFTDFQATNFSGRAQASISLEDASTQAISALENPHGSTYSLAPNINVHTAALVEQLERITLSHQSKSPSPLAQEIADLLKSPKCSLAHLFACACQSFSTLDFEVFYSLTNRE